MALWSFTVQNRKQEKRALFSLCYIAYVGRGPSDVGFLATIKTQKRFRCNSDEKSFTTAVGYCVFWIS